MTIAISTNEIFEALRAAAGQRPISPDDAFTMREIQAALGWSNVLATGHLLRLKAEGMIQPVRVVREALDGRMMHVPAYRLLNGAGKRKAKK